MIIVSIHHAILLHPHAFSRTIPTYFVKTNQMIQNLKTVNMYPELRTDGGIDMVKTAVQSQQAPPQLNAAQRRRFTDKFLTPEWVVVNVPAGDIGVATHGNPRLKYQPNARTSLLVSYPNERDIFMERIWSDPTRGYGVGLHAFYLQVSLSYLNIQKRYTDAFLKGKGDYQIQKTPTLKVVNRPITAKVPNERWGMDLVDMSVGNDTRYIMSVVDSFSGFLFTRRITRKTGPVILATLQDIIATPLPNGSGGTYPRLLQSDNGGEFSNQAMTAYCAHVGIRQILSTSYHPQANGKIERKNREIRKKIKAIFIRRNSNAWTVADLRDVTMNINDQVNRVTGLRAVDLYRTGYTPGGPLPPKVTLSNQSTAQDLAIHNRHLQEERAVRLTHGAVRRFQVNDLVRVNMFSLSSEYRRKIKAHEGTNKFAVHYSPVISRIVRVLPPNGRTRRREMYWITVGQTDGLPPPVGGPTLMMGGPNGVVPREFAGSQLTLAGDTVSVNPKTIPQMDRINSRN
jgi:transposase InsO family protein